MPKPSLPSVFSAPPLFAFWDRPKTSVFTVFRACCTPETSVFAVFSSCYTPNTSLIPRFPNPIASIGRSMLWGGGGGVGGGVVTSIAHMLPVLGSSNASTSTL